MISLLLLIYEIFTNIPEEYKNNKSRITTRGLDAIYAITSKLRVDQKKYGLPPVFVRLKDVEKAFCSKELKAVMELLIRQRVNKVYIKALQTFTIKPSLESTYTKALLSSIVVQKSAKKTPHHRNFSEVLKHILER